MTRTYRFRSDELHRQGRMASLAARRHREICGLLVNDDFYLRLVPVRNTARYLGAFEITPNWWRIALWASGVIDGQVVGTYHSHPISPAEPGEGDITGTWDGALMLIFSAWGKRIRLWQIRDGFAQSVRLVKRPV